MVPSIHLVEEILQSAHPSKHNCANVPVIVESDLVQAFICASILPNSLNRLV